jgi:hypothetical protein
MSAVIAKTAMGFCSCGLQIEPGEQVLPRSSGAIHVGCPERTMDAGPTVQTESSGFLFDDPVQAEGERVKERVGAASLAIHGATYSGKQDKERLTRHLLAVFELMKDGQYRTTAEVASEVDCLETTAHARIRQLRSIGHQVPKRWIKGEDGASGHFEYALIVNRSLMGDEWESQHGSRAA